MILELLFLAAPAISAIICGRAFYNREVAEYKAIQTKKEAPLSDTVQLIIELLRSDEGWSTGPRLVHTSGVRLRTNYPLPVMAEILSEEGKYVEISLTRAEATKIAAEREAYETRRKNSRERELTRMLAKRIVSGTPAPAVLGGPGGLGLPPASAESVVRPPAALTYDKHTKQIVKTGGSDTAELILGKELCERYNLGMLPTCNYAGTLYGIPLTVEEIASDRDLRRLYEQEVRRGNIK